LSENKIDQKVDKVVNEVIGSVWMKRFFKLILASIIGPLAGTITSFATYGSVGKDPAMFVGWGIGLIVFFVILMRK
jgi:hypothetical protein